MGTPCLFLRSCCCWWGLEAQAHPAHGAGKFGSMGKLFSFKEALELLVGLEELCMAFC